MTALSWTENYGDDFYEGFDMTALNRDEYYLRFINNSTKPLIHIFSTYEECIECQYTNIAAATENYTSIQSSEHLKIFRVALNESIFSSRSETNGVICDIREDFGEFGIYDVYVNDNNNCDVKTIKGPVNIYVPIFTVFLIYAALVSLIYATGYLLPKLYGKSSNSTPKETKKGRVKSLDTFRGISIVLMIFVNYGCGGYAILDHAIWNGLHIADVIFPWFLWIMGVCIPISVSSLAKKGISKKSAILNILRRSIILFLIGMFLGASPYLDRFRALGVLQRFGISYFVVATLCVVFHRTKSTTDKTKWTILFEDIIKLEFEWIGILLVFLLYEFLNYTVAAPGCPRAYNGPGGFHNEGKYFNCTGGAAGYIDRLILGVNHIYQYPTIKLIYQSQPFDPEGLLGCLTSIIQVFFGVQAGVTMLVYKEHKSRLFRWGLWALITGLVGGALCEFKKEGGLIPINKNLWSLSFVFVTTSLSFLLLCICYFLVDMRKWWNGKPFLWAGMNATIMYVGHSMTYNNFIVHWYFDKNSADSTHFNSLLADVWATGVWILVSYYLYKIKFFLSI